MKHLCKFGVAFSRGFAQVRLAFSVFIALGRAPTRGVRNDEVIILRAPRHKCVWVWVQCSAVPCLVAPAAHLCANPSNRLSRLSRWTQVFRRCAWVWRGWVSRVSGPARRAYVSALLVTKHFKGRLLRGDSVLRSVHTRCSCLMQPVCSGRRRCALAQCGRAPGPGWARKRGIRESPRTEARAHAQAKAAGSGRTVCVDLRRSNSKPSLRFRREVGGCHLQASVVSGMCTG